MRITRPAFYLISIVAVCFSVSPIQARELTTFEDYAKMDKEQQDKIVTFVFGKIMEQTYHDEDDKRRVCMENTFLSKYGDRDAVKRNHGLLSGQIAYAIETPTPTRRIEYVVANYMIQRCPRLADIVKN